MNTTCQVPSSFLKAVNVYYPALDLKCRVRLITQLTTFDWLTYSILEVLMSNQFEVLFYGFGGQSVLSEDKVFPVDEPVYLTHRHVRKEILENRRTSLFLFYLETECKVRESLTLAFPVLCSICTSAQATSSLLLTLSTGSKTAHRVR